MKKKSILKGIGVVLLILLVIVVGGVAYLTVKEYRPEPVEEVEPSGGHKALTIGKTFDILTYNVGYAGLSKDEDFFMDGGKKVQPPSKKLVKENMKGIGRTLKQNNADVYFLQEVDKDSKRSYHMNQTRFYSEYMGMPGMFAYNFNVEYIPYPVPPIGQVKSGLYTMTKFNTSKASRISLPESFKWPVKICNLKRCMLESRIPIEGSDKELVLINFHLEAYDSGEGKIAQSKKLAEKLQEEYQKGNYVIAGGDFNQTFEGIDKYPVHHKKDWVPGVIKKEDLPEHFAFANDDTYPTCRLLNGPYKGNYKDSQVYVIDGFIISDNIKEMGCQVINTDFAYTDHQPVKLSFQLKGK